MRPACRPAFTPLSPQATGRAGGSGGFGLEFVLGDRARILPLGGDVAVDELDDRDRRRVGGADAGLDDAGIAAVAVRVARPQHVEQLLELRLVEQAGLSEAAVGEAAALGQSHQLLDIGAKLLRLGGGGCDLLVLDERSRHVAEQGGAVAGGALELTPADAMTHGSCLSFVPEPYSEPDQSELRREPWYSGPRGLPGDRANPKKERGASQPRVPRRSSRKAARSQGGNGSAARRDGAAEPNPRAPKITRESEARIH